MLNVTFFSPVWSSLKSRLPSRKYDICMRRFRLSSQKSESVSHLLGQNCQKFRFVCFFNFNLGLWQCRTWLRNHSSLGKKKLRPESYNFNRAKKSCSYCEWKCMGGSAFISQIFHTIFPKERHQKFSIHLSANLISLLTTEIFQIVLICFEIHTVEIWVISLER
jgi:hypothetical protein